MKINLSQFSANNTRNEHCSGIFEFEDYYDSSL